MIPVRLREVIAKGVAHPVTFLLAINIASAALGTAQLAVTLAVLKPTDFAVIGVLAAIGSVMTGLLDVKLGDLTTRLLYAVPKGEAGRRGALLATSLWLHLLAGGITCVLVLAASLLLAPGFLQTTVPDSWWIGVMAARMGAIYPVSALTTFLRILGAFGVSGWLRLASQAASTVAMVLALWVVPSLDGYFLGAASASAIALALAALVATKEVHRGLGTRLWQRPEPAALSAFRGAGNFLAGSSLAGIAKLLSRSCDVLVVAALGNDTLTGLYRVARQGYDTIAGLTDAVHQFYTPTIVDSISRQRWGDYRKHRFRLMLIGGMAAGGVIAGSWLVLRPLATASYPHYLEALPAFEVLGALLVVTLGIHGWLWPTLVASGRMGWFGLFGIAGALLQLGALAWLGWSGRLDATTAALAAWIMALVSYGPLLLVRWRHRQRTSP
ncbi:MAG: hypothetical protein SFW09_13260 [Hyphomicrobiaceae bacterium]|nr:hypothetical protein [Hyphomicrobiaceae bacterium]